MQGSSKRARPGGRASRVVAAVHAATLELLDEDGFENLQLPAVADRAGVNRTTVYRRWATRVDLVADLITTFTDVHVPDPRTGSFEGDLVALLSEIVDALRSRAIRSVLRSGTDAAENDPRIRAAQNLFWERRFLLGSRIVERAVASGELPRSTDPRALLELAAGPVYFRALFTAEPVDDDYIARLVPRVLSAFAQQLT